jgi:predicted enzyme related to lactoylglutathione lyase
MSATPTASIVTGVDFVTVPTRDVAAAVEFYGNVLGLPCSVRYDKVDGAEFETGNLTLSVLDTTGVGMEFQTNKNPIALRVGDLEAARAELESRGVAFQGETFDSGVCRMAMFADPDGNALMLHHRYAPRTGPS